MNAKNIASSPTARKVVGSLGVLGAAAAVAGMGTFGTFTDSSTPVATTIASGTLSIDVTQQGFTVPVTTSNFVPGDSMTRAVNLINDGSSALGSVTLASTVQTPSILTTDATNGLQLAVKSCSVAVDPGRHRPGADLHLLAAPSACSARARPSPTSSLTNPASLVAGGTDYLTFAISLPASADNTFQGKSAALSLTFTGTQRTGSAR